MKKTPLFAIILVALSLGCSISDSPVGPGLMIKEFKFTPNDLYGNQKTALTLVIQNKGSKNINGAYAEIYGFGKESDMWLLEGGETETTTVKFNLRAPSSYTNNVGEEKRFVWLLSNNDLIPKDAVRPYTANARVCYTYETSVLARTEIISENEWMSNPPPQHQIDVKQTTGPVRITILSKQPVIMSSKVSLDLLVENVGSGTVAQEKYCDGLYGGDSIDSDKLNRIDMEISGISDKCVIEGDDTLFLEQGRRQKITVSCEVSGIDAPITTADVEITLNYDYYLDTKAIVRVEGPVVPVGTGEDEPDLEEPPLITDELAACELGWELRKESDVKVECDIGDGTCVTECYSSEKYAITSSPTIGGTHTPTGIYILDGKHVYDGGGDTGKDIVSGENELVIMACDENKETYYLDFSEKVDVDGGCEERTYVLYSK